MDLDAETSRHKKLNLQPLYDKYGYDSDDEAFYDDMKELVKKQNDEWHKKLMRGMQILAKVDGKNVVFCKPLSTFSFYNKQKNVDIQY